MQHRRVGAPPQPFRNATDSKAAPSQPLIMDTRTSPINNRGTTRRSQNNIVALPRQETGDLVDRMAADLLRFEATGTESDAVRSLMATRHYSYGDIATFVDDALAAAQQQIVTAEMARAS